MTTHTLTSTSLDQTLAIGGAVGRSLAPGDIIALIGELGAGKTQFVRGLAAQRGADPRAVSSPTFVLMQEYEATPPVVHIDAYRINHLEEVEQLGWDDTTIAESISVIEWADRIDSQLPDQRITIEIEHTGETTRQLTITADPSRLQTIVAELKFEEQNQATTECPICQAPVRKGSDTYPFCSMRCKTIDLGRWLGGDYKVSRSVDWDKDNLDQMSRADELD